MLVDKEFLLTPKGIHHVEFVRTVMERVAPEHPNFAFSRDDSGVAERYRSAAPSEGWCFRTKRQ